MLTTTASKEDLRGILARQISAVADTSLAALPFAMASIQQTVDQILLVAEASAPLRTPTPAYRVVDAPKNRAEIPGRMVRAVQELKGRWGTIAPGTAAVVLEVRRNGYSLYTERCGCCNLRVHVDAIHPGMVEFIAPL